MSQNPLLRFAGSKLSNLKSFFFCFFPGGAGGVSPERRNRNLEVSRKRDRHNLAALLRNLTSATVIWGHDSPDLTASHRCRKPVSHSRNSLKGVI